MSCGLSRVYTSHERDLRSRRAGDHHRIGTKMQPNLYATTYMHVDRRVCCSFHTGISTFCAYPALVQHVSVAAAGARGDSASVAYSAEVNGLAAVCDAVTPCAARAIPSARTTCICDVSCAVALARGDARAAADLFVFMCVCQRERKREREK